MKYCLFENTLEDLYEVADSLGDILSKTESDARDELVELCRQIVESYEELVESGEIK